MKINQEYKEESKRGTCKATINYALISFKHIFHYFTSLIFLPFRLVNPGCSQED